MMKGSMTLVKGRMEEAAGMLSGSEKLRAQGHRDAKRGVSIMEGSTEVVMGRIEEAAGLLTGNAKMRAKGQKEQVAGHVKQSAAKPPPRPKKHVEKLQGRAKAKASLVHVHHPS